MMNIINYIITLFCEMSIEKYDIFCLKLKKCSLLVRNCFWRDISITPFKNKSSFFNSILEKTIEMLFPLYKEEKRINATEETPTTQIQRRSDVAGAQRRRAVVLRQPVKNGGQEPPFLSNILRFWLPK
ncbi:MAG: hypothetical protein MJ102_06305 [Clostridia bacterium]|nr:hypothetical protein [Clostridia bacterium]